MAGVSQATVSRVLNGNPNVAPETRDRVLEVVDRVGYELNESARRLITRRSHTVGVIVDDITNPFYPELIDSLADETADTAYRLLLLKASDAEGTDALRSLPQGLVDGVIFTAAMLDSAAVAEAVRRGHPIVLLNRYVDNLDSDLVVTDNIAGGALIGEHLLALGHRRIGLINGLTNTSTARDRAKGFLDVASAAADVQVAEEDGDFSHDSGVEAARALLAQTPDVTAVFATNDAMAMGVINHCRATGLRVPEDLSVVGFDDLPMAAWPIWDLTTVKQPIRQMAARGLRLLFERLDAPNRPPQHQQFETELVVRGTTGPAPA